MKPVARLADILLPLLTGGTGAVSFVGAGGKTSLMIHLARELAEAGCPVLVTTTTKLADPRGEATLFTRIVFRSDDAVEPACESAEVRTPLPGITLIVTPVEGEPGKVAGIDPAQVGDLRSRWPFVLVEADGARHRPIKAPESWEPVVPEATDITVGVVGLDALGRAADDRTVHRLERFVAVTGCAVGVPIAWEHLVALVRHPEGLFKAARGRRIVVLNKADEAGFVPSHEQAVALGADLVVLSGQEAERRFFGVFAREPLR